MKGVGKFGTAAMLVCSSCSEPLQQEEEPLRLDTSGLVATISVEGDVGNCRFQWDGESITTDDIVDRGIDIIAAAVEAHSGAENMIPSDIPYVRVRAEGDMPYHCISLAIGALQVVGFSRGELEVAEEAVMLGVDYPIMGGDPPPAGIPMPRIVALDDRGHIFVEGELTSLEDLPAQVMHVLESQLVAASLIPVLSLDYGPDYFVLPSARTQFAQIVATAKSLSDAHVTFELLGCYRTNFEAYLTAGQVGTPLPTCYD